MAKQNNPTADEFLQLIQANAPNNPQIASTQRVVIKSGPQTYKVASVLQIQNPATNEIRHKELRLNSFKYRVGKGIDFSAKERLAHWSCTDDEIEQLRVFLNNFEDATTPGEHIVVRSDRNSTFAKLLESLGDETLNTDQLVGLVSALADRATDLRQLPQLGESDNVRMVAAALRVAHRTNALESLHGLIATDAVEQRFQELLEANWWMLGGQYIEMIPRRDWTVEDSLDILLKSADRYFEIIELKRSNASLFVQDHGNWIVSGEVNRAVNQAAHYIAEIEADRSNLLRKYKVDLYKLKAKVLIGHLDDDDEHHDSKREALRTYNSHLSRIEVLTYDELYRIADNVVHANLGESGQEDIDTSVDEDGLPF
ncbi:MAG: hypothetical protein CMJ47_06290 [Planctomyces sp.]|nr:hypothetical protein [Planctomyces sp.]